MDDATERAIRNAFYGYITRNLDVLPPEDSDRFRELYAAFKAGWMTRQEYYECDLEEMVSYRSNVTGVSHTVFISPRGNATHGPRVKVAIDPPHGLDPRGRTATVTIDGDIIGTMDGRLAAQARMFVQINREVLLDYWFYRIDTDELRQRLRSIVN